METCTGVCRLPRTSWEVPKRERVDTLRYSSASSTLSCGRVTHVGPKVTNGMA